MLSTKHSNQNNIIFLFGPTGVGKTDLLLNTFAQGYEVISADSIQVYKGLDIGSAKPSKQMLHTLPHHLIDILDPYESWNVSDFVHQTDNLILQIQSRANIPVISGGTAYYFKHTLFGLPDTPPADPETRQYLEKEKQEKGLEYCASLLQKIDPASAAVIAPGDGYRILRALEVYFSTGKPLSSYTLPDKPRNHIHPLIIGLNRDRDELYSRINQRVELMFEMGLYREVQNLLIAGATEHWPAMKGIGYREFFTARKAGEFSLKKIKESIKQASRTYAKRQLTFFRSLPQVHWFHPDEIDKIQALVSTIKN